MKKVEISIIAAIGKNRELGKDNKLLWHIPEDLKRFKQLTQGHAVIMGRKTYESIGKPLTNRVNIVITRNSKLKIQKSKLQLKTQNLFFCNSLEAALHLAKKSIIYHLGSKIKEDEVFVIGGGQIFELALPYADKLYLTIVEGTYDADTFFPDYSEFNKVIKQEKKSSQDYTYTFLELKK